jgi:cytochrome c-type biogenesis protein CcmH
MIWVVFAILTGIALLAVLAPLAGRGTVDAGDAADRNFYAEQIGEISRERAEGRLSEEDAEAARREAQRRLLGRKERLPPPHRRGASACSRRLQSSSLFRRSPFRFI